jgi:hypothetical protein
MIHIEKLSLKNIGRYTWQTFVDHFVGTDKTRKYYIENSNHPSRRDSYIRSEKLSLDLFQQAKDISLGKYFGTNGIDIDLLLLEEIKIENLVVELSPEHFKLLLQSKYRLKLLLENYSVLISDFEESGTLFGFNNPTIVEILSNLNIKPKQLFLVGGCFGMQDYPKLNIFKIQFDYWLSATPLANDFYSNAIFDNTYKQTMLDKLDNEPSNFCIIPILKPRSPRLKLLTYLDSIDVLNKCDWSCGYNLTEHIFSHKPKNSDALTKQEVNFLSKYEFPKLFNNLETTWASVCSPETEWFNKYKFYISAETYMGDEVKNEMGSMGFISEKTYKSFLIGSTPIIYGAKNSDAYLKSLGFKTASYEIDNTDYVAIGDLLHQKSLNKPYELDLVQHNFDLITNKDFLVSHIATPLNKIAELINSIRR